MDEKQIIESKPTAPSVSSSEEYKFIYPKLQPLEFEKHFSELEKYTIMRRLIYENPILAENIIKDKGKPINNILIPISNFLNGFQCIEIFKDFEYYIYFKVFCFDKKIEILEKTKFKGFKKVEFKIKDENLKINFKSDIEIYKDDLIIKY